MSKIEGKIYSLGATKEIKEGFTKREGILHVEEWNRRTGEKYENFLPFEAINGICSDFDGMKKGETVELNTRLRGNLWKDPNAAANTPKKAILSLQVWAVKRIEIK